MKQKTATNSGEFKLAEARKDGTLVLEVGDGRMFVAPLDEGLEADVLKSSTITVTYDSLADGVPVAPVVTKIDR